MAGTLLGMARGSHLTAVLVPWTDQQRVDMLPKEIGIRGLQRLGYEMMVFEFGKATFGFDIPQDELRELGEALMALSAMGSRNRPNRAWPD